MTRQRKYFNTKPFLQNGFTTSFYLLKCYKFGSSLCLSVIIKPTWLKISGRVYLLKSKFWALPVTLEEPISLYKIRVLTAHRGLLVFSRMKTWGYEWEGHEKNFQGQPLMSDCPLCFAEHCMLTYQFCVSVYQKKNGLLWTRRLDLVTKPDLSGSLLYSIPTFIHHGFGPSSLFHKSFKNISIFARFTKMSQIFFGFYLYW